LLSLCSAIGQDPTHGNKGHRTVPRGFSLPIFVVRRCEYLEGKILHVRHTSDLNIQSIVGTDVFLHVFQHTQKFEEDIP
jgi:hypothetical protein